MKNKFKTKETCQSARVSECKYSRKRLNAGARPGDHKRGLPAGSQK